MKKIGLVLAYKGVNYGMLLQAFATQRMIEKMGYDTEIIDYTRIGFKHIRFTPYLPIYFVSEVLKNKQKKKNQPVLDEIHKKNIADRKSVSNKFIEDKLLHRVKINGVEELEKYVQSEFGGVLIGSDQIWPPDAAFGNFTTLRFAPDDMNKVSYATSLGVSKYPFWCKSSAKNFMKRINHISVREEQGKEIINGFLDKDVKVVCDPTYLFSKEEWQELIPDEKIIDGDYVLCYFLGDTREHKMLAKEYCKKHGVKLVSILSTESSSDIDVSYADKVVTGLGPDGFINLIRHAKAVMTDSFHGLAFSVINNKEFYVFYRTVVGSKNSRNSRIDNILNMWGLQSRLVLNDADVDDFDLTPIDYVRVNALVEKKRAFSMDYLTKALGDCK